jgi:radical SAM superfamily enzyme YgiQ (UPF0313 family)
VDASAAFPDSANPGNTGARPGLSGEGDLPHRRFVVALVKPSHYDDDGYVIQWWKSWIPSNSLACLYGIARDIGERRALGSEVDLEILAYDECHTVIPLRRITRRIRAADAGLVCLVGVQSNQFPRAMDLAARLRAAGIMVAVGGFHVSGLVAMLPELPPDLKAAQRLGVALFAGEAEGRLEGLFADALAGRLQAIYNHMADLPALQRQVTPFLPLSIVRRYAQSIGAFDAGRGCPFQCSFCTIINVQGRRSRWRDADDVERLVRANLAQGVFRFFITDDNFARNRNWEAIFDRLIAMREGEGLGLQFIIQVDTLCHRIPNFVEKAARVGCKRVFIGLENINPDNLLQAKKKQNRVAEYRRMFDAWRAQRIITYAGYILGFPGDTPARITADIATVQRELPVDLLEFFILTPLPGSADHQKLYLGGAWMDPDMNKYDLEHVTARHPLMTAEEWQAIYRSAWDLYYSDAHIETIFRRAKASGIKPVRLLNHIVQFYFSVVEEHVHPLQGGYFRRKLRRQRRAGLPRENPLVFYPRRAREAIGTQARLILFYLHLHRIRRHVERDREPYIDPALTPIAAAQPPDTSARRHTAAAA